LFGGIRHCEEKAVPGLVVLWVVAVIQNGSVKHDGVLEVGTTTYSVKTVGITLKSKPGGGGK